MYERFYNLRERPFALSPDPEYLYLSRVHGEALDSIRYGVESRAGFIVVTGEIGAGKTTLLQTLLQRLDDRMLVARIVNTMLDPRELIEAIALDFGLPDTSKSKPALLRDLGMFLVEQRTQGRRPLLVIDEAQNLSPQSLEEVRLLSNLETEKSKLLQILLAGQPNLRDKIASPELEQFRQRVAVSYHLMPLDPGETAAYIKYRLDHAALGEPPQFSPEACDIIYRVSGGVPRLINVVCDASLVFGYAEERRSIDRELLEEVVRELEATGIIQRSAAGRFSAPERIPEILEPVAARLDTSPALKSVASAAPAAPIVAARALEPSPPTIPAAPPGDAIRAAVPAGSEAAPATPPAGATGRGTPPAAPSLDVARPTSSESRVPPPAPAPPPPPVRHLDPPSGYRPLADRPEAPTTTRKLVIASEGELARQRDLVARRQAELAAREEALLQRERQIAEQRRIMGEEYRLLRNRQAAGQPAIPRGGSAAGLAHSRAATASLDRPLARHSAAPTVSARLLLFWQRILRIFTGAHALRS